MIETKPDCSSAALAGEVARLKEENARLQEELRHEHEMHIRNLADFDNWHRRAERERAQAAQAGKRELLLALLGVMDEFERALAEDGCGSPRGSEGLRDVYRRLSSLLAAEGILAFESLGQRFDPARHEVLSFVEQAGAESGTILDEVRRGYCWGTELLRPAQVRVAQ
ncbi:MAG TPA: nucleotide exchange factor GrpE [Blastocatellia bacterium]|nr:nucleotide exchange factor GrpE [Blastocatellia bacterium]